MICPNPNCKANIPDGSTFCPDCGTPIKDVAAIRAAAREIASQYKEGLMVLFTQIDLSPFVDNLPIEYCEEIIANKDEIVEYDEKAKERDEENRTIEEIVKKGVELHIDGYYDSALERWHKAAKLGSVEAYYCIGLCYENGKGVPQDAKVAVDWYSKAANLGYDVAQNALARCYENGEGVKKADKNKASSLYRKAAEHGHAEAQYNLGRCYTKGIGVSKDYEESVRWYYKAAEQGYAEASNALGTLYAKGKGVEKDYKQAAQWYHKAAVGGHAGAQYNLGNCYAKGNGVDKDMITAYEWYKKAAEQGYHSATKKVRKYPSLWKIITAPFRGIAWLLMKLWPFKKRSSKSSQK